MNILIALIIATLDTAAITAIVYNIKQAGPTNWQIIKEYRERGIML